MTVFLFFNIEVKISIGHSKLTMNTLLINSVFSSSNHLNFMNPSQKNIILLTFYNLWTIFLPTLSDGHSYL